MSVVLMYHAIFSDQADKARVDIEDQPYAVSLSDFIEQMELVATMNHGIISDKSETLPDVIVTFDDGHVSNVEHALPVLRRLKLRAYFFVTTDFIAKRSHFCDWDDLGVLLNSDMIVGSHGTSHRFFDDMTQVEMQQELSESKQVIEQQLGNNVHSISFPGGRYTSSVMSCARAQGYEQIYGSDFGQLSGSAALLGQKAIKRIPVRQSTSLSLFTKLVCEEPKLYAIEHIKTRGKQLVKRVLGNRIYHGLYTALAKNR